MPLRSYLPTSLVRLVPNRRQRGEEDALDVPSSSFPFLSGDSFRALASIDFQLKKTVVRHPFGLNTAFASCAVASIPGHIESAIETVARTTVELPETLVISNGDQRPSDSRLLELAHQFPFVYCVNVQQQSGPIRPLPIGLENLSLNNNGRLQYYFEGLSSPRTSERGRLVISSFHTETNPQIREGVRDLFARSRFGFDGHRWKRREYRLAVMSSCFVISPPGAGLDCHRTWESIYLGAIPVVKRSHFPDEWSQSLPIMAVDSYDDFVGLSDEELRRSYGSLIQRPINEAFLPHWIRRFEPANND